MTRLANWLDLDLCDLPGEQWRTVAAYDGYYEVSNLGRVKSLRRYIEKQNRYLGERIRKQSFSHPGYQATLALHVDGVSAMHMVMRLVGDAFLPPLVGSQVYYRSNGNPKDSRAANISVGLESGAVNHRFAIGTRSASYRNGSTIGDISKQRAKNSYGHLDVFDGGELMERECKCCLVRLPITDFYASGSATAGHKRRLCKSCDLKKYSGTKNPGLITASNELKKQGLKKCGRCKLVLGLDCFYVLTRASSPAPFPASYCRDCERAKKREQKAG